MLFRVCVCTCMCVCVLREGSFREKRLSFLEIKMLEVYRFWNVVWFFVWFFSFDLGILEGKVGF